MKKVKNTLMVATIVLLAMTEAHSSEVIFNPNTQFYDMNSNGVLSLWGVPEANGNALVANPDFGWPTELAVASWYAALLKAQELGMSVGVGYDPNTLDIWYIAKPR
jgi:hypothetical protein